MLKNTHPHGPENEALHALEIARAAVIVAYEKCLAADFGNVYVLSPLESIRDDLERVIRVIEGKA